MPKKNDEDFIQELKEIETRAQNLIVSINGRTPEYKARSVYRGEKGKQGKADSKINIGDTVLIKKPKKGQETIGEVVSIGEKFVTVKTETQTIRRIQQNLKKVGR